MELPEQPLPPETVPQTKRDKRLLVVVGLALIGAVVAIVVLVSLLKPGPDLHIDRQSACKQVAPTYIGLSESDATQKAKQEGRIIRVVERDGKFPPVTQDFSASRLDFTVTKKVVRGAGCG